MTTKAKECVAPHPTSHIIKELFAHAKVLCDSCYWPRHSSIQKHLNWDIYPAHILLTGISAAPKDWVWNYTNAERRTQSQTTAECEWFSMIHKKFGGLNCVSLPPWPTNWSVSLSPCLTNTGVNCIQLPSLPPWPTTPDDAIPPWPMSEPKRW